MAQLAPVKSVVQVGFGTLLPIGGNYPGRVIRIVLPDATFGFIVNLAVSEALTAFTAVGIFVI
jgi:hypothetical protein